MHWEDEVHWVGVAVQAPAEQVSPVAQSFDWTQASAQLPPTQACAEGQSEFRTHCGGSSSQTVWLQR